MNAVNARETVVLIRQLRDGATTEERLERWLAELVVSHIPHDEPDVAMAKSVTLPVDEYRQHHYPVKFAATPAHQQALALAQVVFGSSLQNVSAPLVA
jgi:hypothetical protein